MFDVITRAKRKKNVVSLSENTNTNNNKINGDITANGKTTDGEVLHAYVNNGVELTVVRRTNIGSSEPNEKDEQVNKSNDNPLANSDVIVVTPEEQTPVENGSNIYTVQKKNSDPRKMLKLR